MSDASTWGNGIAVGGIVFGLAGYAAAWWRFAGSPKARLAQRQAFDAEHRELAGKDYDMGYDDGFAEGRATAHRERAQKAAQTRKRNRANAGGET